MSNKILIGLTGLLGLSYLISKTKAEVPIGTLDIISCPTNVGISSNGSASISVTVKALYGNVLKSLKIVAGTYTDIILVSLNINQIDTFTFTVPNVTQNTQYTVSVI